MFDFIGIFECGCPDLIAFSEDDCLDMELLGDDELSQLRVLRLLSLREGLDESRRPGRVYGQALAFHRDRLAAYLDEFFSGSSLAA